MKREIQSSVPETGTALPGSTWPGSGLVLDPAWPTAPPPPPRPPPCPPSPHLLFCNFLFLLSRQNAERERLVNEAHAHTLARTRSVPSSPFPCASPRRPPALPPVSLLRHYPPHRCLCRPLLSPSPPRPQTQCATSHCLGVTVMTYSHMHARRPISQHLPAATVAATAAAAAAAATASAVAAAAGCRQEATANERTSKRAGERASERTSDAARARTVIDRAAKSWLSSHSRRHLCN